MLENQGQPARGAELLGDHPSRLSQASLRLNENLDLDTALQAVMDGIRFLTNTPCANVVSLED